MNGLACCAECSRVAGVGDWAGFLQGAGNFLGSDLGKALVNVGLSVGTAYALKEIGLTGGTSSGGSMTATGYVNPASSGFNPQAAPPASPTTTTPASPGTAPQPIIIQSAGENTWVLPVAIGFAAVIAMMFVMKKR
jgi:hypothetical protein